MFIFRDYIIQKNFLLAGPPVYYSGRNEPSYRPQFKWPHSTFNLTQILKIEMVNSKIC
jgi:hypothetical protein